MVAAILGGCHPCVFLENRIKGRFRVETHIIPDTQNRLFLIAVFDQSLLGLIHAITVDEIVKILPEPFIQNLGKMPGRDRQLLGKFLDGEILPEKRLSLFHEFQ